MIEKMFFIDFVGYIKNIDDVIENYILKFNMYPESENSIFNKSSNFVLCKRAEKLLHDKNDNTPENLNETKINEIASNLQNEYENLKTLLNNLRHFKNFDFDYSQLAEFKFIHYKFGFMPLNNYKQYRAFLYDEKDIFLFESEIDENFIWCAYFTYAGHAKDVDNIFSALNFETIDLPFEINGLELSGSMSKVLNELKKKLSDLKIELKKNNLLPETQKTNFAQKKHDLKKFCIDLNEKFFVFKGWISKKSLTLLNNEIKNDDSVMLIVDKNTQKDPPVLLKNNFLFRPFEFFVKMYGLPDYREIDPTPFLAITYTILFGLMFGDIGQGFVLFTIGILLSFLKKSPLFKIISILGISSMIFGTFYGSIFGFEELLPAIWLKPSGNITFILFFSVGTGIFLILLSMLFNLINCEKIKDYAGMFFNSNGICGISFYVSVIVLAVSAFTNKNFLPPSILFYIAIVNLIFIAFANPIKKFLRGEKKIFGSNIFLFLLETLIELFETVLTYFTNTVSFIRVGAFALSHAGMMNVVMLLAQTKSGSYNWPIVFFGNILVIALEGLIVGIQALRLEFYEMFGRFFKGTGRKQNN